MTDLFGQERMLALSWKEPFGTAMLAGKIETRVWSTKYRGLVLICLSQVGYSIPVTREICGEDQFDRLTDILLPMCDELNRHGMAIAVGRLVDCREMRKEDEAKTFVQYRAPWVEHRRGKDGRIRSVSRRLYCHIYEDISPIKPFPWKGCQGWSEVSMDIRNSIEYLTTGKPETL